MGAVRDKDNGYEKLRMRMRAPAASIVVGVDSRPHEPSGKPTDEIALIHEYGQGVPQRSFLRAWVDENLNNIELKIQQETGRYLFGEQSWTKAQERIGQYCVNGIRARMMREIPPPLLDTTIARKHGPHPHIPLLDTMQMYEAVVYELKERGNG